MQACTPSAHLEQQVAMFPAGAGNIAVSASAAVTEVPCCCSVNTTSRCSCWRSTMSSCVTYLTTVAAMPDSISGTLSAADSMCLTPFRYGCCPTHLHAQSLYVSVQLCCSVNLPLQLRQLSMTLLSNACLMFELQDVLV